MRLLAIAFLILIPLEDCWSSDDGHHPFAFGPVKLSHAAKHRLDVIDSKPIDPWRVIDGSTNLASGPDWVLIIGRVVTQSTNGALIDGHFESTTGEGDRFEGQFFVSNYQSGKRIGQRIESEIGNSVVAAKMAGQITITNDGAIFGTHRLDYGTVWERTPEWYADQKAKAQAIEDARKQKLATKQTAAEEAALRYNQTQADKGDMQGLFRMGQRYATGDGVVQDLAKAREYLQRAATAGHPDAATALADLPAE